MIDTQAVVAEVNEYIESEGFKPRDADGNDFQRGVDNELRFKTGTSYGEVAIQIVRKGHANPMETIRILTPPQIGRAKQAIRGIIDVYDNDQPVQQIVNGAGETVKKVTGL